MKARASRDVIAFPTDRVRRSTCGEAHTGPGKVVIFSGVRIERMTDEPRTIPKAGMPVRKRGQRR
jgi:hypothetical protein